MLIGGKLGYRLLRWMKPPEQMKRKQNSTELRGTSKLEACWGEGIWNELSGKTVIDFGCGRGNESIEMAKRGAKSVVGIDILQRDLDLARESAAKAGVAHLCSFVGTTTAKADVITSTDAFEHFADPAEVLRTMADLLKPDGCVLATFGPTWYHPKGGHSFSIFPWAHLVFTERCLIRWRSDFKCDGASRFSEVEGGLNRMSIRRFHGLVAQSRFGFDLFETVPIRGARTFFNPLTREFLTSIVRCRLKKKG
jgi:SAM-dependent methyltransferase